MPDIRIVEQDETRQAALAEITDVVYVPGFVCTDKQKNSNLFTKNKFGEIDNASEYVGIKPYTPTLFNDMSEFITMCGDVGVQFDEDQKYQELTATLPDGSFAGFSQNAIPFSGVMFNKGDYEPGYIMAKELLAAGLPVLFERMNVDNPEGEAITKKPADWENVFEHYVQLADAYNVIKSSTAPTFFFVSADGEEYDGTKKYYKRVVEKDENDTSKIIGVKFEKLADKPATTTETYFDPTEKVEKVKEVVTNKVDSENESENAIYFYKNESKENPSPSYFLFNKLTVVDEGGSEDAGTVSVSEFKESTYFRADDEVGFALISSADSSHGWEKDSTVYTKVAIDGTEGGKEYFERKEAAQESYIIKLKWVQDYYKSEFRVLEKTKVKATSEFVEDTAHPYFEILSGTTIKDMYNALSSIAFDASSEDRLIDKGNYNVKYLTSGGYPVYEYNNGELVTKMKHLAYARGDCVALIDHTFMPERNMNIDQKDSLYYAVTHDTAFTSTPENSYAAMFTPWCKYSRISSDKYSDDYKGAAVATEVTFPASFAYLTSLADSIKTYANWMAVAGVTRGMVQHLSSDGMLTDIPNGVADKMSTEDERGIYINPITNIRPYGYAIWGNRTLLKNEDDTSTQATSFLNIRNLVSDIKKLCYTVCRRLTFEPNSDSLWTNIQAGIMPTLDRMQSGYGISGYQLAINKEHPEYGRHATFCFKIILYPVYPVERFRINVILRDNEVTFE